MKCTRKILMKWTRYLTIVLFYSFTKDGVLVEGLFWKDVEALINDYAAEPKKSKWCTSLTECDRLMGIQIVPGNIMIWYGWSLKLWLLSWKFWAKPTEFGVFCYSNTL
jgi:hypothetical protein